MGYSTQFEGVLKFKKEPSIAELAHLQTYLGEDVRDHADWGVEDNFYFINLELTDDFLGVKWNGAEKTYGMDDIVNFLTREMKKVDPDFGFEGEMLAQGEEIGDTWRLVIKEGVAFPVDMYPTPMVYVCPECGHEFEVRGAK